MLWKITRSSRIIHSIINILDEKNPTNHLIIYTFRPIYKFSQISTAPAQPIALVLLPHGGRMAQWDHHILWRGTLRMVSVLLFGICTVRISTFIIVVIWRRIIAMAALWPAAATRRLKRTKWIFIIIRDHSFPQTTEILNRATEFVRFHRILPEFCTGEWFYVPNYWAADAIA